MKSIAIIGSGPTGIYTFYHLLKNSTPLSVSVFEQADDAGVGMPYNDDDNSRLIAADVRPMIKPIQNPAGPMRSTTRSVRARM